MKVGILQFFTMFSYLLTNVISLDIEFVLDEFYPVNVNKTCLNNYNFDMKKSVPAHCEALIPTEDIAEEHMNNHCNSRNVFEPCLEIIFKEIEACMSPDDYQYLQYEKDIEAAILNFLCMDEKKNYRELFEVSEMIDKGCKSRGEYLNWKNYSRNALIKDRFKEEDCLQWLKHQKCIREELKFCRSKIRRARIIKFFDDLAEVTMEASPCKKFLNNSKSIKEFLSNSKSTKEFFNNSKSIKDFFSNSKSIKEILKNSKSEICFCFLLLCVSFVLIVFEFHQNIGMAIKL